MASGVVTAGSGPGAMLTGFKRPLPPPAAPTADPATAVALTAAPTAAKKTKNQVAIKESARQRSSGLLAPIMALEGHSGEVFTGKFSPDGRIIASSGFDRQIFIWNVYGECDNLGVMSGHTGAVLDLHFSTDSTTIYTASTDKTVAVWDVTRGERVRRLRGHQSYVNACSAARRGPPLLCSGSDDGTVRVWDARRRGAVQQWQNMYQVTAVTFTDTQSGVLSAGIDNDIKMWDMRSGEVSYKLQGHSDTVTGIELSSEGSYLLSNSMDNTLRVWDVRPYAARERCVKLFQGHQHGFEKNLLRCCWSDDGSKISAGSADRHVYIWDTTSRAVLYKLPGHTGSVNETDLHPTEPIVLSCSSDKTIYLGELE